MVAQIKNWLIYKIHDRALKRAAQRYASGRLVDVGCGIKPYKELFSPYVTDHIGVEHEQTLHGLSEADLVGTAYDIPASEKSFNTALLSAVLEHLEEPDICLREIYRVLAPSGVLILTVPFIWHIHEAPRDYYRYSKYGLDYLLKKAGFEVLEINALSGFWVTFGQLFVYNIQRFNRGPLRVLRLIDLFSMIVQLFALGLEKIDKTEDWTWMYIAIARRPKE